MVRIGVKMENMNRYQAVLQLDDGAIAIAPSPNKIYHSYFPLPAGKRLVEELKDAGINETVFYIKKSNLTGLHYCVDIYS